MLILWGQVIRPACDLRQYRSGLSGWSADAERATMSDSLDSDKSCRHHQARFTAGGELRWSGRQLLPRSMSAGSTPEAQTLHTKTDISRGCQGARNRALWGKAAARRWDRGRWLRACGSCAAKGLRSLQAELNKGEPNPILTVSVTAARCLVRAAVAPRCSQHFGA